MKILQDVDLDRIVTMPFAIDAMETAFRAKAAGSLVAPPRHHVSFSDHGDLVFTIGGVLGQQALAGFRAYETFDGKEHSQVVAVWSADNAQLKGIVLGERLGQIRTGAIGGLAIRHLSSPDARTVGVLGSGPHARMQLLAAVAARNISTIRIFSRDRRNRMAFAESMQRQLNLDVEPVDSVAQAVADADIVLCATNSNLPVIHASDLKAGAHINTVGPKTISGHEISLDIADVASVIVTDSLAQTCAYRSAFFLAGSGSEHRMRELADIVVQALPGRTSPRDTTLFCSVGLAGTEVILASAILDMP